VVKFEEYDGRPCALVQEKITLAADVLHPIEILHTYVKGLGEMEQRRWVQRNSRGDKILLMERKVVIPAASGAGRGGNLKSTPAAPGASEPKGGVVPKKSTPAPK
jgi:hypothetical protein